VSMTNPSDRIEIIASVRVIANNRNEFRQVPNSLRDYDPEFGKMATEYRLQLGMRLGHLWRKFKTSEAVSKNWKLHSSPGTARARRADGWRQSPVLALLPRRRLQLR